jgi:ribosomal protein L11 methyltransferase
MTALTVDWTEVVLRVLPDAVEDVAGLLQEVTGAGVVIEPAIEALGPDEGYILDEQAPLILRAYFYGPVAASQRAGLRRRLRSAGLVPSLAASLTWRTVREEDWAESWKTNYNVERVGRIVIRPAWRDYEPQPGDVVVSLDPGMAFGTGQHPTTRMCLAAMQDRLRPGDDVLDLGSGSGILAVAAVALGAKACLAIDTEEQAVDASLANAALNGFEARIPVCGGSIEAVPAGHTYDLVLANINAATIINLARPMHDVTKPKGVLIVSGIIAERLPACEDALTAAGLAIEQRLEEGEWRALVLRRS